MSLVPLFDLKFLTRSPQPVQEFQIGGTRGAEQPHLKFAAADPACISASCA